jgi:AraC-like DNA-binding protein
LRIILEEREESGKSCEELLSGTGLSLDDIYQPDVEVEVWQELSVIERIATSSQSTATALSVASRQHITSLGPLGHAMMASRDLKEAFEISSKYHSLSLWLCDVGGELSKERFEIFVLPHSLPNSCQSFCAIRGLAALKIWISEILSREIIPTQVSMKLSRPDSTSRFNEFFGCSVDFESEVYSISFDKELLDEPLKLADAWARDRSVNQLKEMMSKRQSSYSNKVRELIITAPQLNQSEGRISSALEISGTTLRRRLREEGTNFRDLRLETLHQIAQLMLAGTSKSVDGIADLLGYAEAASFVRSFKRREGVSPGVWRKMERSKYLNSESKESGHTRSVFN